MILGAALVCLLAALPRPAAAALGEPEASAQTDTVQLKGTLKAQDRLNYRVHEIQLPSGTLLREYSVPGGVVFAITFSGPFMPDLKQTLGRFFDQYAAAAPSAHASRHHLQIRESGLVVEVSGHMRAFNGRAYLPAAVPFGVSIGELP